MFKDKNFAARYIQRWYQIRCLRLKFESYRQYVLDERKRSERNVPFRKKVCIGAVK